MASRSSNDIGASYFGFADGSPVEAEPAIIPAARDSTYAGTARWFVRLRAWSL